MVETYERLNNMLGSREQAFGKNGDGENVIIERGEDHDRGEGYVRTQTFQSNGWVRNNYYYEDGTVEELFDR